MKYPKFTSNVLFANKYYPSGLTKEMVSSHYKKNKQLILSQIDGKRVTLLTYIHGMFVGKGLMDDHDIYMNSDIYDDEMYDRNAISIKAINEKNELVVGINYFGFVSSKKFENEIAYLLNTSIVKEFTSDYKVVFSDPSFNVHFLINGKMDIDIFNIKISSILKSDQKYISSHDMSNPKPKPNNVIFDLRHMSENSFSITPNSLCRNGLVATKLGHNYKGIKRSNYMIE